MANVQAVGQVVDPSITSLTTSAGPAPTDAASNTIATLPRPASPRKRRRSASHSPAREVRILPTSTPSKAFLSPTPSPRTLTGAFALTEGQQKRAITSTQTPAPVSPNSAKEALDHLIAASRTQMSRPSDGPLQTAENQKPSADHRTPPPIQTSIRTDRSGSIQVSPKSFSTRATAEDVPMGSITSNGATTASPGRMEESYGDDEPSPDDRSRQGSRLDHVADSDGHGHKAMTFPGSMSGGGPRRTTSLPQTGFSSRENSTSSVKRHKCPYCDTDFTRHHNLKSHLLTHSQEKPFSCDRCDSRFRRLHDLKRHAKLHTGERPHVCPKCDRSFARGDALARHNKGQGGCAGRRESVGSFAGDDRHDDSHRPSEGDNMIGIMYTNETSHEPEHMEEDTDSAMERALPKIQRHEAPTAEMHPSDYAGSLNARQPSTYPPVASRPAAASLYPPPTMTSPRRESGATAAKHAINHYPPPTLGSNTYQQPTTSVFTQSVGMTESPKPLSPGSGSTHQLGHGDPALSQHRSPNLTQAPPQASFRRTTGNSGSSPVNLPPPSQGSNNPHAPHLPPLHGLNPPESRYTLHSQQTGPSPLLASTSSQVSGGGTGPIFQPGSIPSAENSTSSHGTANRGSLDRGNPFGPPLDRLWAVIDSLTTRVHRLEEEVASLKKVNGTQQISR